MDSSLSDSTGPIEEDERSRNRYGSLVVAEEAIEEMAVESEKRVRCSCKGQCARRSAKGACKCREANLKCAADRCGCDRVKCKNKDANQLDEPNTDREQAVNNRAQSSSTFKSFFISLHKSNTDDQSLMYFTWPGKRGLPGRLEASDSAMLLYRIKHLTINFGKIDTPCL